ncbi:MAG: hypothetical protein KBB83_08600 [Alphaproteobacteria bacterium]|nr:hypothetical protein [Alphaproteobacteria bacterium]
MKFSKTSFGVLNALLISLLLLSGCNPFKEQALNNRNELIYKSAFLSEKVLAGGDFPSSQSASVYVSNNDLRRLLGSLEGTRVVVSEEGKYKGWEATTNKLMLSSNPGYSEVEISVTASPPEKDNSYTFTISSILGVTSVVRDASKNKTIIWLAANPTSIKAHMSSNWFSWSMPTGLGELLADIATTQLGDKLSKPIEIDDVISEEHSFSKTERMYIDKENNPNWWIDIKPDAGVFKADKYLNFLSPAFTSNGLWLAFSVSDDPGSSYTEPDVPFNNSSRLEELTSDLTQEILKKEKAINIDHDSSLLWLSQNVFVQLNELLVNNLKAIKFQSTKKSGMLAESKWRDDILGEGGTFAELDGDNAVSGSLKFGKPNIRWDDIKGVIVNSNVDLDSAINIHVHFDPLVGRGLGTTVGMEASSSVNVDLQSPIVLGDFMGSPALMIKPDLSCKSFDIEGKTDGKLKFSGGWASMPALGLRTRMLIGEDYIPPSVLIGGVPTYTENKVTNINDKKITIHPPYKYTIQTIKPTSLKLSDSGMMVQLDIILKNTNDSDTIKAIEKLEEEKKDKIKNYYASASKKTCPSADRTELILGALEIGPNNEFVKAYKGIKKVLDNAYDDLTNGPGEGNEIKKAGKAIENGVRDIGKALGF